MKIRPALAVLSGILLGTCGSMLCLAGAEKSAARAIRIEVLPGQSEKWIDPVLAERIPVAIFGEALLDVREIDPATLVLAGAAATKDEDGSLASYEDVDGDGITDLIVRFDARRIRLGERSTQASLWGRTADGRFVAGSGSVASVDSARARRRRAHGVEKLPPIRVRIDVLPGDPGNEIELGNRGTVTVAVLSAAGFDATRLDPAALSLAASPVTRRKGGGLASFEDVDGDGLRDLVVEVSKKLLRLAAGSTRAVLAGVTPEGRPLTGSDRISLAQTVALTFDSDDPQPGPEPPSVEFANNGSITINDVSAATPYPSTITVAGAPGVVSKLRVTLKNLTHSYLDDVDVLLVGPTGQSLVLMSDVGGIGPGVSNVTLTFDDDSAIGLDPLIIPTTGTYRPADAGSGDTFPAPAPAPTAATTLSAFTGTNPNGTWSLYVVDDNGGDVGTVAGGWAVDFVLATEFCNAGPITIGDLGIATPYPSPVVVTGLAGVVQKVTASFKGLTHTLPGDIDSILVGPNGQTSVLLSDTAGIAPGVSNVTLVLDENAPLLLEQNFDAASGTYQPDDNEPGESLPGPAPAGPYSTDLGIFRGTSANGTWNLYLVDDAFSDTGTLPRFCLAITTMTPIDEINPAAITIPAGAPGTTAGPASLYPSSIAVSGVIGTLVQATAVVRGLTHSFPADLDVLLTAPTGGNVLLMSDVGGGGPGVSFVAYAFDDTAGASIPPGVNAISGVYKPSNDDTSGPDALPAPAPAGPYGSTLAGLNGGSPNGTWSLYVYDDTGGDVGDIAAGWSLKLKTHLFPYGGCNSTAITIPAGAPGTTQGPASAYPVGIVQIGVPVDLDQYKVRVDLVGLTHSFPRDLDVLLVGPQGQKVLLMSDTGGAGPGVSNVDLAFDDDAASGVGQNTNPASGTYRPTDFEPGDAMPGPAPAGPYSTSLAAFKGTNPLGGWALYVADDLTGDVGSLGAWCLSFVPSISAGEVPSLRFTDKVSLAWDAGPNATSYNVYRGDPAQLPLLLDHGVDSCLRGTTLTQSFAGISEVPAAGTFRWFLVRGNNAQGEGPPGFDRLRSQILARVEDSSGVCP